MECAVEAVFKLLGYLKVYHLICNGSSSVKCLCWCNIGEVGDQELPEDPISSQALPRSGINYNQEQKIRKGWLFSYSRSRDR